MTKTVDLNFIYIVGISVEPLVHVPDTNITIHRSIEGALCLVIACFEQNIHIQVSIGDSDLRTTLCEDHVADTTFLFHDPL